MNQFKKALVASVATGLVMGGFASAPALAQDPAAVAPANANIGPVTPDLLKELAGGNRTYSLTIHKHADGAQAGARGDGTELANVDNLGESLNGATFKVEKVQGIDLTTNEGWRKAAALNGDAAAAAALGLDAGVEDTTANNGEVTFDNLAAGLYVVTETKAPEGYRVSTRPFLVAVPMTNPNDRASWLDEVHVYPKNTEKNTSRKTVDDAAAYVAGDEAVYTITGQVAQNAQGHKFYQVNDFYPKGFLEFDEADVANTTVTLDGVELTAGVDYEVVDKDLQDPTSNVVQVKLTKDGLDRLNAASVNGDATVEVTLRFDIVDNNGAQVGDLDEQLNMFKISEDFKNTPNEPTPDNPVPPTDPNDADTPDPNDPNDPNNPDVPPVPTDDPNAPNPDDPATGDPNNPGENFPRSYFGKVDIYKAEHDNGVAADQSQRLDGAVFDLYITDENGDIPANATPLRTGIQVDADPNTAELELRVLDWENNQAVDPGDKKYALVETKAPDGFQLLTEPVYFTVLKGQDAVVEPVVVGAVINVGDDQIFNLPLTGGKGVAFMLVAGSLVVIAGGTYYVVSRRREA